MAFNYRPKNAKEIRSKKKKFSKKKKNKRLQRLENMVAN